MYTMKYKNGIMQFTIIWMLIMIGYCFTCPESCFQCASNNITCEACSSGYYITDIGECRRCRPSCLECKTSSVCTACRERYYLPNDHELCYECGHGCRMCKSPRSCKVCMPGYYLVPRGDCYMCINNPCPLCNSLSTPCTSCPSGFYLDEGNCIKCYDGCVECNSLSTCTSCVPGYCMDNGSCNRCCRPCASCTSPSSCSTCDFGYYLTNNSCIKCSSPCLQCTSAVSCSACMSGYYLDNDFCYQCSSPCLGCTTQSICTSCTFGYYLSNGTCVKCHATCLTCSHTMAECTSCPPRFYLSSGTCVPCATCCSSCNGTSGICIKCERGYYGQYCQFTCDEKCSGYVCEHISGNCVNGCNSGYYQVRNECDSCPSNCSICQNMTTCTGCIDGHYLKTLKNGSVVCFPCDEPCSYCLQSQCIRQGQHTESVNNTNLTCVICSFQNNNPETSASFPGRYVPKETVTGIAVGSFFVGLVVGLVALLAMRILRHQRETAAQSRQDLTRNPADSVPPVLYVNTSNLDSINELKDDCSTYETISARVEDGNNYSSLSKSS